jgi:hypothetical protein
LKSPLLKLVGGTAGLWLAAALPAWYCLGEVALLHASLAAALCLVPIVATLGWACRAGQRSPMHQLIVVFGGTGLRMAFVLGGGLANFFLVPGCRVAAFWIWVLVFYLATLVLEVGLVFRAWSPSAISTADSAAPNARLVH